MFKKKMGTLSAQYLKMFSYSQHINDINYTNPHISVLTSLTPRFSSSQLQLNIL